jgi:hypothetical protein
MRRRSSHWTGAEQPPLGWSVPAPLETRALLPTFPALSSPIVWRRMRRRQLARNLPSVAGFSQFRVLCGRYGCIGSERQASALAAHADRDSPRHELLCTSLLSGQTVRNPRSCNSARSELPKVVRSSVEETLNGLPDAEADDICRAQRYEHSPERVDTRASSTIPLLPG